MPTFSPNSYVLDFDAIPLRVVKYDRLGGADRFKVLPHVRCVQISYYEGSKPPAARFEYIFNDADTSLPYPDQFEECWPLDVSSQYAVKTDDELVVFALTSAGNIRCLFDGFVTTSQVDIGGRAQNVTFEAAGVAIRCWDTPIGGAPYRNANEPNTGVAIPTSLPIRFNPDRLPNCTPDDHDVNQGSTDPFAPPYPIFLDQKIKLASTPQTYWTLGKLTRFLLGYYNADQTYITNPYFPILDSLLASRRPLDGQEFYDPNDSSTYQETVVKIRDMTATGRAWPEVLEEQLRYAGFTFRWQTEEDPNTFEPYNTIEIYRLDASVANAPKAIYLPPTRSSLDTSLVNVGAMSVVRDHHEMANQFLVESQLDQYEVSVVLAPGFEITVGDQAAGQRGAFKLSQLLNATADVRNKYRLWIADEVGEGHWNYDDELTDTTPLDLSSVLGSPSAAGTPAYVYRHRPGKTKLISMDSAGKPLKCDLSISTNYAGAVPGVWDGTGTWQSTGGYGWELLPDRLGIRLVIDDPEAWGIAKVEAPNVDVVGGPSVMSVTCQAAPNADHKLFYLRLTTVIEGDKCLTAIAEKRDASPSNFAITRRIDARDHFTREILAPNGLYNPGTGESIERDDTESALAHAAALRSNHEFPSFAGSVTIPFLANSYIVSDRIYGIVGRDVDMRTNSGAGTGEAPQYPVVVGVTWNFENSGQKTTIQLSDRRADPQKITKSVFTDEEI